MTRFAGVSGLAGWQWLFLLEGLPTALLGLVVLMVLKDRIADAHWLNADAEGDIADQPRPRAARHRT